MKWHNLNVSVRVKINSGFALLLFLVAFFGLLLLVAFFERVSQNFLAAGGLLTTAFGAYLRKEHANNQLDLEAAKAHVAGEVSKVKESGYAGGI